MRASILTFAGTVAAQNLFPSPPGVALPFGVQAPSTSGFTNPSIGISRGGKAVCVSGTIAVPANTTRNIKFNYQLPQNQTQLTETFVEYVTSGSPFSQEVMGGKQSVAGVYSIGATLCTPANNTAPQRVQLLTHGVGFDRYYWDFAPGYSYVDAVVENGYAAFFYDRLGVGVSEKADALSVVQSPLEVEIAHNLAIRLRNCTYSDDAFDTVVGVGHSFGSIITQAITALYPTAFDAAILTGFSTNSTALPTFISSQNFALANQNQPARFQILSNGYLVSDTAISNQIGFFRPPGFDPSILYLAEMMKGTVTIGELFTTTAVIAQATNYTRPVAVVDGVNDFPFCFGNCSYPTDQAAAVQPVLYPSVAPSDFGSYLAPVAGHGLNLHYSSAGAYQYIQNFLNSHGLGA